MAKSQYTANAVIPVGSTYDTTNYILGITLPDNTIELIPKVDASQFLSIQSVATFAINFKIYNTVQKKLFQWTGLTWVEINDATASSLVSNTATGQTVITIDNTVPPTQGQVLTAKTATKASWQTPQTGGTIVDPLTRKLDDFSATVGGPVTDDDTILSSIEKLEYKSEHLVIPDMTYTNATPVPEALGGIQVGKTFNAEKITDVLTDLLYPYQNPAFTAFSISGQSTTLEVGNTSNANPTFNWTLTNSSNVNPTSLSIQDITSAETLVSNGSIISPASITHPGILKTTSGTETYTISATNSKLISFTRNFSIAWRWAIYYGENVATGANESLVLSLRMKALASSFASTYSFSALSGGYKWFCYPTSFGLVSAFKDTATNLGVPFEAPVTISITNSFNVTTNYYCYRSTNALGGSISIMVS